MKPHNRAVESFHQAYIVCGRKRFFNRYNFCDKNDTHGAVGEQKGRKQYFYYIIIRRKNDGGRKENDTHPTKSVRSPVD